MADEKLAKRAMNCSFEVFNDLSRGRGIKTKISLNKGSNVLSCEPFAFVSTLEKQGKICDSCLGMSDTLQRCSSCKMIYYCRQSCQRKAWKTHKLECKFLKGISPFADRVPSDVMRLLGLIMLKSERVITPEWLNNLIMHSEEIRKQKGEEFARMREMLERYLGSSMKWNSGNIFDLFCKVNCNAFTICDAEQQPVGLGLYRMPAFLNHSCEPNCIAVFVGATCHIRSITDIAAGKELCISYTELLRPHGVRQEALKDQYYFDCTCPRCTYEIAHGSEMNALKCAKKECLHAVGYQPGTTKDETCTECCSKVPCNYDSPSIHKLYQKIEIVLASLDETNEERKALRICEDLLNEAELTLHHQNFQVLKIVDKITDLSIQLALWKKALHCSRRSLEGYRKFYPESHPGIGLQHYRIGKLEAYLDTSDSGLPSFYRAKSILEVCYGKQHSILAQLNENIHQLILEKNTNEARCSMLEEN